MKQRLGIALSLMHDPEFLILDEPINGLDPAGIVEMRKLMLRLNKENGLTIIISSHILSELANMATCYGFIDHGQILQEMSAEELEAKEKELQALEMKESNNDMKNAIHHIVKVIEKKVEIDKGVIHQIIIHILKTTRFTRLRRSAVSYLKRDTICTHWRL